MSERKVLNKYYPPDFDPSKIPRIKGSKNRQFTVRLMAPCNMRCKQCGEYIYKGKKFNARKEDVENKDYLGIRIFRFYIKCTRCLQEISFITDPQNTDYIIEAGATRNFMALKLAEEQAEREEEEKRQEEATNPMKLLENRTSQSKQELEILESLEELRDMNKRQQSIDYNSLISNFSTKEGKERLEKLQQEEDEKVIRSVFGKKTVIKEEIVDNEEGPSKKKKRKSIDSSSTAEIVQKTNILEKKIQNPISTPEPKIAHKTWSKSVGTLSRSNLTSLVKPKCAASSSTSEASLAKPASALALLGSYSDSDNSGDSP